MSTVSLTLDEIFNLAKKTLLANGCDEETSNILSDFQDTTGMKYNKYNLEFFGICKKCK